MHYIVGLGNPGEKYQNSRHNAGWIVLEDFVASTGLPALYDSSKYSGRVSEGVVDGEEVSVLLPDTYMNKSGSAVKKLVPKDAVSQLVVVYDDIDLPVGEIKVSFGKGAGGHNGVQSVIDAMGSKDFIRIRIGIAATSFWTGKTKRPKGGGAMTRRVLGPFTSSERSKIDTASNTVAEALFAIIKEGYVAAMNQYN